MCTVPMMTLLCWLSVQAQWTNHNSY